MRGVYTANIEIDALVAAQTLMYITAPADQIVEIIGAHVTDLNNVTNQQIECAWQRITTLGSPSATTLTPSKHEGGDQAAGSTVKGNCTSEPTTYTANTELGMDGVPVLGGWHFEPLPEERPTVKAGLSIGLRLLTTTITSTNVLVRVTFREVG